MNRLSKLLVVALVIAGCASQKSESGAKGPVEEKQKISNLIPFDLINCFPNKLDVPQPANEAVLAGMWVAAKPRIDECLVDPKNRGPEKTGKVSVVTTVTESGVDRKVTGVNLSPAGQKCIEDVFAQMPELSALPKGSKPATFPAELAFTESSPSVTLGLNELSDMAATVRLAQSSMCACYAPWKDASPKLLKAKMLFTKGAADGGTTAAPELTFTSGSASGGFSMDGGAAAAAGDSMDASSTQVSNCLKEKVAALPFVVKSDKVGFTYPFITLNSRVADVTSDMPGNMQVLQLDGVRAQRSAVSALKLGARINAARGYDEMVTKYKKNPRSVKVPDLKAKCQAMLQAEDDYRTTLESQRDVEQKAVTVVGQLKAQDAQWADTEALAQKNFALTDAEAKKVAADRKKDEGACPKSKF